IESLIGSTELHVCFKNNRIVALNQRIKKFVDADRLLLLIALFEVFALEHARHIVFRRDSDERHRVHFLHPAMVKFDYRFLRIKNLEDLLFVSLRVLGDLFQSQLLAGFGLSRRVTNYAGKIADQENHLVSELLELLHLLNQYRMTKVKIRRGGIKPSFHPQRPPFFELCDQLVLGKDIDRAALDNRKLFIQIDHKLVACQYSRSRRISRVRPFFSSISVMTP